MKTRLLLVIGLLSLQVQAQQTAHYEELNSVGGKVNWTTGRVSAEGYGVSPATSNTKVGPLLACRAAVVDAQRNLLEATEGVRVTATTVIDNYMLANDEVKSQVEGIIKNARLLSRSPDNTGGCKVTMEISLAGKASSAVYRELNGDKSSAVNWLEYMNPFMLIASAHADDKVETTTPPWVDAVDALSKRMSVLEQRLSTTEHQQAENLDIEKGPTGLVVDARGSNFIPSLSPKIRQLRGGIVYPDAEAASSERLLERGQLVSLFARDVDFAIQHPTVGSRPLLVKALRTYGDTRTEIVLSTEYAQRIAALNEAGFFKEAGVIIVLD